MLDFVPTLGQNSSDLKFEGVIYKLTIHQFLDRRVFIWDSKNIVQLRACLQNRSQIMMLASCTADR